MTPDQASAKATELKDLIALQEQPAFKKVVLARIEQAEAEHLIGATRRDWTPAQRAEHIEAYHLAAELSDLVPKRIERLRKELADYTKKAGTTTFKVSDALA